MFSGNGNTRVLLIPEKFPPTDHLWRSSYRFCEVEPQWIVYSRLTVAHLSLYTSFVLCLVAFAVLTALPEAGKVFTSMMSQVGAHAQLLLVHTVFWKHSFKKMKETLPITYALQKLHKCVDHTWHRLLWNTGKEREAENLKKQTHPAEGERKEKEITCVISREPLFRSAPLHSLASCMVFPLHQQLARPESLPSLYVMSGKNLPDLGLWLTTENILIQVAPSEGYTFLLLMYWQFRSGFSSSQMLAYMGRSEFTSSPAAGEFGVWLGQSLGKEHGWMWDPDENDFHGRWLYGVWESTWLGISLLPQFFQL